MGTDLSGCEQLSSRSLPSSVQLLVCCRVKVVGEPTVRMLVIAVPARLAGPVMVDAIARKRSTREGGVLSRRAETPASDNAANISTKSRFIAQVLSECPRLESEGPDHGHPVASRKPAYAGVFVLALEAGLASAVVTPVHGMKDSALFQVANGLNPRRSPDGCRGRLRPDRRTRLHPHQRAAPAGAPPDSAARRRRGELRARQTQAASPRRRRSSRSRPAIG